MLYRLLALVLAALVVSITLSWYLKVPVLAFMLRLLLAIKGFKWMIMWQWLRTYTLTKAPITLLWDMPYRALAPWARGIGLANVYNRMFHRFWQLLGWIQRQYLRLPFWVRVLLEVSLTIMLITLMMWNNWFLLLIIFVPSEVTRGISLFITRYIGFKLANTALLRYYNRFLRWLLKTRIGKVFVWLNKRYEVLIGERMEKAGAHKRAQLEKTDTGQRFVSWLDRHFPEPPLFLKPEWCITVL